MDKTKHLKKYRDTFNGIKQSFVEKILGKKITVDEWFEICKKLEKDITNNIQTYLEYEIEHDKLDDEKYILEKYRDSINDELEELIEQGYLKGDDAFPAEPTRRILVEIVQDKIPEFEKNSKRKKYKE